MIIRVTKFIRFIHIKIIIKFEKQTSQNNILNTATQDKNGIINLTHFLNIKMPMITEKFNCLDIVINDVAYQEIIISSLIAFLEIKY